MGGHPTHGIEKPSLRRSHPPSYSPVVGQAGQRRKPGPIGGGRIATEQAAGRSGSASSRSASRAVLPAAGPAHHQGEMGPSASGPGRRAAWTDAPAEMACWEHGTWTAETVGCEDQARSFPSIPIRHPRLSPTFADRGLVEPSRGHPAAGCGSGQESVPPDGGDDAAHTGQDAERDDAYPSARPSAAAISDRLRPRSNGAGGLSSPTRLGLFPRGVHRLARPRWPGRSGQQRRCRPAERCRGPQWSVLATAAWRLDRTFMASVGGAHNDR